MERDKKSEIIESFSMHEGDTGSTEVQVAIMTERIEHLTDHLRTHVHDEHSRRGLLRLVGRRKRLLSYLRGEDASRYLGLITRLGLRK